MIYTDVTKITSHLKFIENSFYKSTKITGYNMLTISTYMSSEHETEDLMYCNV